MDDVSLGHFYQISTASGGQFSQSHILECAGDFGLTIFQHLQVSHRISPQCFAKMFAVSSVEEVAEMKLAFDKLLACGAIVAEPPLSETPDPDVVVNDVLFVLDGEGSYQAVVEGIPVRVSQSPRYRYWAMGWGDRPCVSTGSFSREDMMAQGIVYARAEARQRAAA